MSEIRGVTTRGVSERGRGEVVVRHDRGEAVLGPIHGAHPLADLIRSTLLV